MALIVHSSSTFPSNNPHLLPHKPPLHSLSKPTKFSIKSQDSSTETPISGQPTDDISSTLAPPPKKPNSTGLGFGSSSTSSNSNPVIAKKKQKGKTARASIIRRAPVEKPKFISEGKLKEQGKNETVFLLTWLGLGSIILVQGIFLAVSGFLPEEWDNFCVKFVYPSFTPTVILFFVGTVAYGVLKYLQNEKANSQN